MMIEDDENERIFPGDNEIEDLTCARGALGNILCSEFLQVDLPGSFTHRLEQVAYEERPATAASRGPNHLPFPSWI